MGGTLFEELGFYYVGPVDGHNLDQLIPVLENVRDADEDKWTSLRNGRPLFERPLIELDVPDPCGVVPARGDHAGTIGAERGAHHPPLMVEGAGERLAARRVPFGDRALAITVAGAAVAAERRPVARTGGSRDWRRRGYRCGRCGCGSRSWRRRGVRRHSRQKQIRRTLHQTDRFDQASALVERQRRVHLDPLGGAGGEQVRHRPSRPPPGAIPQREIDRRERGREVALIRAGGEQLGVPGPGVHAAQHLAVGVQRRGDHAVGDAVVGLEGRRLADAEVLGGPREPDPQDLALPQLAPRGDQRRPQDQAQGCHLQPGHRTSV